MRKLLKIIAWIAGIFLVLLIIAVIGLKLFFPLEKAKALAIEKGSAALGREINVEGVDISIWGGLGVQLVDVTVGNPPGYEGKPMLTAEDVDIKLQLWPLISGNYAVDRLIVNKPEIRLVKNKDGSNNFTFTALEEKAPPEMVEKMTPEGKAAAVAVTFDHLEIRLGILSYTDDSSGIAVDLSGLSLSTSLENPRAQVYQSTGELSVASVRASGLGSIPDLAVELGYRAAYDIPAKLITLEQAKLTLNGVELSLAGEAVDPLGVVKTKLGIKSERIAFADIVKFVPSDRAELLKDYTIKGELSVDVDLEYDQSSEEPLTYYGTSVLSSTSIATAQVPGEFKFKRALIDFKNDNLRFNIEDGTFDGAPLKGHMVVDNFADPVINGELAGRINLACVQPFLPPEENLEIAGQAEFAIKLSGRPSDYRALGFSGDLKVTDGRYNSVLLPEPIDQFDLEVYFDNRLTHVRNFSARTESGTFSFDGRINDLVPYILADSTTAADIEPTMEGRFDGRLDLALLNSYLPQKGNPQLSGQFDLDLNLIGVLTDYTSFKPRGTVSITNASYTDSLLPEPLQKFETELVISPDTITVSRMDVAFVSSDASFTGQLINPFPYLLPLKSLDRSKVEKPLFLFALSSKRFDVDKLFPEAVPGSGGDEAEAAPLDSVSAIILPDIDGNGIFALDTLVYSGVEFNGIDGKIKIRDRKIECYDVTGMVYTGQVAGNTTIDLTDFENPRYAGEFRALQIEADDFVSRFSKFGGYLKGKIDLDGTYNATGWDAESFLNSLTMNSISSMKRGTLTTSGAVHSAIAGLADKAGQSFDKEQTLKNLVTNINVRDGKVYLDQMKTKLGDIGDLDIDGFYAFSGEIDYNGSILLSKAWTEKLLSKGGLIEGLAGLLSDKSVDRVKLPLSFGGTLDKPEFKIDYSALTKDVGDNISKEAGDFLNGLLKKK